VIFRVEKWPWDLIINIFNVLKCNFADVDEALFNDVEMPFERILYILGFKNRFGRTRQEIF
jgi:hypothetical protein